MITVLGMWEPGWMEAERTERRLWKQTVQAFGVTRWAMADVRGGPFTSPVQYETLQEMLAAHPGPKTFLIPPGRTDSWRLADYVHPQNAIYVFGNSKETLVDAVTPDDEVVSICTPNQSVMFGHVALAPVLFDRMVKQR